MLQAQALLACRMLNFKLVLANQLPWPDHAECTICIALLVVCALS